MKPTKLSQATIKTVMAHYGRRCYHPDCTLPINNTNPLCCHDITDTGNHDHIELMRPVCMTHHNQATAAARTAKVAVSRFRAHGITVNENQNFLIEKDFYGEDLRG